MIEMTVPGRMLTVHNKWFYPRPSLADGVRAVCYRQSQWTRPCAGFVRQPFSTSVIDLSRTAEEIFTGFGKTTRNEIHRAEREGLSCDFEVSAAEFVEFYNRAAVPDGRVALDARLFESAGAQKTLAAARSAGRALVMRSYVVDAQQSRACSWHSATVQARESDPAVRRMIGRANRLLHFRAMLHFKQRGFVIYDLGGYSNDSNDRKQQAINQFKDGFGGTIVEESHFYSYSLYASMLVREALARLTRRRPVDRAQNLPP